MPQRPAEGSGVETGEPVRAVAGDRPDEPGKSPPVTRPTGISGGWTRATGVGLIVLAVAGAAMMTARGTAPGRTGAIAASGRQMRESAPAPHASTVDYRLLESRIAQLMQDPDMVGLAVGTIEGGQIQFIKTYGETLANSGVPVTPDTVFRWASVSKSVASALVVGLAEDGELSLAAPLPTLRTTLTVPGDGKRVTVADILSHRLGLVRNAWDDRLEAGEDPKVIRAELGTLPPLCPPATCYAYQNIAYDAASEIVERVTGKSYADAARDRLFRPLGMDNASVGRAALESAASWAHPHHRSKRVVTVADAYYRIPAAGGVNSSIRDLLVWMQAQTGNAPDIMSPGALAALHRPRVSTPPHGRRGPMDRALTSANYGLGWRSYVYAGHNLVGHRGSVEGYRSLILFDPAAKSGIVMLWNSDFSKAAGLQLEFFDLLYGLPSTDWLQLSKSPAAPDPAGESHAGGK